MLPCSFYPIQSEIPTISSYGSYNRLSKCSCGKVLKITSSGFASSQLLYPSLCGTVLLVKLIREANRKESFRTYVANQWPRTSFYLSFIGLPRSKIRDNSQENLDFFFFLSFFWGEGFLEKLEELATTGPPCQWQQLVAANQQLRSLIRERIDNMPQSPLLPIASVQPM